MKRKTKNVPELSKCAAIDRLQDLKNTAEETQALDHEDVLAYKAPEPIDTSRH